MFKSKFRRIASEFPLLVGAIMYDLQSPHNYEWPKWSESDANINLHTLCWRENLCELSVGNVTNETIFPLNFALLYQGANIYLELSKADICNNPLTRIEKIVITENYREVVEKIKAAGKLLDIISMAYVVENQPGRIKVVILRPKRGVKIRERLIY